jgi:beta-lactam-binding protein with PASTA domain
MGFFYFLKKRKFYKHLLIATVLTIALLWISLKVLSIYTRHGDVYLVPDFTGKTLEQLNEEGFNKYFDFQVIDSVYDDAKPRGSVFMQNPVAGSKVKQGRHLYLTVVASMPEKVIMPNLKNLSLRQALVSIDLSGLRVGHLEYVDYFARNAVIDQLVDEEPVEAGTELNRGTLVSLVLGKGEMKVFVPMPFIIGKSPKEALRQLHYASLNRGSEVYMDDDMANAKVYRTEPPFASDEKLDLGAVINIWYRSDKTFDFENYIHEVLGDTISQDSLVSTKNPI